MINTIPKSREELAKNWRATSSAMWEIAEIPFQSKAAVLRTCAWALHLRKSAERINPTKKES